MLPLQAQNTHSLPRKLPVIWARRELSGQAVIVLGLELQHFGARQAGPPGRAPPARRPGVSPRTLLGIWAWSMVVLGLVVVVLGTLYRGASGLKDYLLKDYLSVHRIHGPSQGIDMANQRIQAPDYCTKNYERVQLI